MLGSFIRTVRNTYYRYPEINQDHIGNGPFAKLKIALVTDYLTAACLSYECRVRCLTPDNYDSVLREWKPDFIFVESAFHGYRWSWSYKLARCSGFFTINYLRDFKALTALAREMKIPAVFWNKDDGVFFDTFIDAALLCDFIYTADANSVKRYREAVGFADKKTGLLQMAIQHRNHRFKGFSFCRKSMCFVGSYYSHMLNERSVFLNEVFSACAKKNLPVDVYNRNSFRLSRKLDFDFPQYPNLTMLPNLSNEKTADVYRQYNVSLNVNSITDSPTMCSRRLLEILACGGIIATNRSLAVESLFRDYCTVINSRDEAMEMLPSMIDCPSADNLEKAEAGSRFVAENFTWEKRIEQLTADLKI